MNAWKIARKDLRLMARDRRAAVVLLGLPIVFISVLGFSASALVDRLQAAQTIHVGLADPGPGHFGRQLTSELRTCKALRVQEFPDGARARRELERGSVSVLLMLEPATDDGLDGLDSRELAAATTADALARLGVEVEHRPSTDYNADVVGRLVVGSALRLLATEDSVGGPADRAPPGEVESDHRNRDPGVVYQELVPSLTVMFVFFLVNVMGRSFVRERELGTLDRLRASPLSPSQILLGKTLPFLVVSLLQTAVLFACGGLVFGMQFGSAPQWLPVVMVCTSLAAVSLGLLVAALVRTEVQVSAYANFAVIGMAGISGCFVPRDWLPDDLRTASLVTPHAWALQAYDQLLVKPAPDQSVVGTACLVLLAFSATFFLLGTLRLRRFA